MTEDTSSSDRVHLTADIVSAYLANNSVHQSEIASLISSVHQTLGDLGKPTQPEPEALVPAVPIKKSITPDYLISLEDGRQYKSLKRHLSGRGMTPVQYREKWGLKSEYPMVAPNYAQQRSELAKAAGLGQSRQRAREAAEAAATAAKPKRSRKPKAEAEPA